MQGDGVFAFVARQKAVRVAEHNRACIHHFGIKPGVAGDLPCHVAVVAVGPIQHGGDRKRAFGEGVHKAVRWWKWVGMIKELRALCKAVCTRAGIGILQAAPFSVGRGLLGSCCKLGCRLLLMFQTDSKAACTSQIQGAGCFSVFGMAATPIRRRERMRGRLPPFWPALADRRAMWTAAASVAGCVRRRGRAWFRPFWAAWFFAAAYR